MQASSAMRIHIQSKCHNREEDKTSELTNQTTILAFEDLKCLIKYCSYPVQTRRISQTNSDGDHKTCIVSLLGVIPCISVWV